MSRPKGFQFPKVTSIMTGVWQISQTGKKATLYYTDGTTETGDYPSDIMTIENKFNIISTIQEQRPNTTRA